MYVSTDLLTNTDAAIGDSNHELVVAASNFYKLFQENNWWVKDDPKAYLEVFTPEYELKISKKDVFIKPIKRVPKFFWTLVGDEVYIEVNDWWYPAKLFPGIVSEDGTVHPSGEHTSVNRTIRSQSWLSGSIFKPHHSRTKVSFWYLNDGLPVKSCVSRSIEQNRMISHFLKENDVELKCEQRSNDAPFDNTTLYEVSILTSY